jgi:hypothetical protein
MNITDINVEYCYIDDMMINIFTVKIQPPVKHITISLDLSA